MTEHDRAPETPTAGPPPSAQTTSMLDSLDQPSRRAAAGAGIVGVAALLAAATGGLHSGPIQLVAAAAALVLLLRVVGRGLAPAARAGLLLLTAALVVILAAYDLAWALRHLDDPSDYGGVVGLIARIGSLVGGVVLGIGAMQLGRAGPSSPEPAAGSTVAALPRRLAVGGALLVVIGWALMVTIARGWTLVLDQAIGLSAAILLGGFVLLVGRGALRVRPGVELAVVLGLAAVVALTALNGIVNVADEWSFVVEVGGPATFVPYLVYLAGAATTTAAGVMLAMRLRSTRPG